jgi:hypothetical protein
VPWKRRSMLLFFFSKNGKHSSISNMFLTDHRTPTKLQSLVLGLSHNRGPSVQFRPMTTKYLLQLYNLSTHEKWWVQRTLNT